MSTSANPYVLQHASDIAVELERLDNLHIAFKSYFGEQISLAPLYQSNPNTILDLGAGSGAWAIDIATQFPDALVTAVDMNPFPARLIPSNIKFLQADLTKPLPIPAESFDVVHMRLVLIHLPNAREVLKRVFSLVKPGGWLLLEDIDDNCTIDGRFAFGPGTALCASSFRDLAIARGASTDIARHLHNLVHSSGMFDSISHRKVSYLTSSSHPIDPSMDKLRRSQRDLWVQLAEHTPEQYTSKGFTSEIMKSGIAEYDEPNTGLVYNWHVVWAQRR